MWIPLLSIGCFLKFVNACVVWNLILLGGKISRGLTVELWEKSFLGKRIHLLFSYYVGKTQLHNVLKKNDTLFFTDIIQKRWSGEQYTHSLSSHNPGAQALSILWLCSDQRSFSKSPEPSMHLWAKLAWAYCLVTWPFLTTRKAGKCSFLHGVRTGLVNSYSRFLKGTPTMNCQFWD